MWVKMIKNERGNFFSLFSSGSSVSVYFSAAFCFSNREFSSLEKFAGVGEHKSKF